MKRPEGDRPMEEREVAGRPIEDVGMVIRPRERERDDGGVGYMDIEHPVIDRRPSSDRDRGRTWSAFTPTGSIVQVDRVLAMTGEIDTELCLQFAEGQPDLSTVECVDARRVTYLGCPGMTLLALVARGREGAVPLWASRPVLRMLRLAGRRMSLDIRGQRDGRTNELT